MSPADTGGGGRSRRKPPAGGAGVTRGSFKGAAGAAAAKPARTRAAFGPATSGRPEEDGRDMTDPSDLEDWLAERIRDWQLEVEASLMEKLSEVVRAMATEAEEAREKADKNGDLRAGGYADGQVNMAETVRKQMERAVNARRARVGRETADDIRRG